MLYKQLNEKRTQGEWNYEKFALLGIGPGTTEEAMANKKYTALAVNNLHHLAEALERILNIEDAAFGLKSFDVARFKDDVKQALARIS